jgi:dTDP-4-amino-4,6-dideoxygalactose transaminase
MIPLFKVSMSPDAAVRAKEVLESGYVGQGPVVEKFEDALQDILDSSVKPLTTSTGTHALDLAYHLLGIGPSTEVLCTPVTCTATASQIVTRGARIVWIDVDPHTGLIDPLDVKKKLSSRTKAIVAVDWGGKLCDYNMLRSVSDFTIPVIQDAAHSFLGYGNGRGDYIMHSFQAIKHATSVDGGCLIVPKEQYKRAKLLRWYGLDREISDSFRCAQAIKEIGYKYHMNDLCAAIGLANLKLGKENVKACRVNAFWYEKTIDNTEKVRKPPWDEGSSWWLYTLLVDDQKAFIDHMKLHGVAASQVHARCDKHPQMQFYSGELLGVDYFASHEVCIPVGWWLTDTDKDRIVHAVREYGRNG